MSYTRAMVIWCLVGAMAVPTVASFALTGLTVDLHSNPSLLLSISGILAFSFFYRYWRPNPHLRALTEVAAQFLLILIFGLLLTYAAVAVKFPYVDAGLHAIDNALVFNRQAYLKFFADRPWLSRTVEFAYFSMLPQFA
ncbi:MAG: hypothetical protein WBZ28_19510, partial [Pseudolabrys sp.]